jgi:hypothetical protein
VERLRTTLRRRLKTALSRRFPPPSSVILEDHDGIIGVVTSAEFAGMDTIDRQTLIGEIVAAQLNPEERRRVQVIVGVTPDEGTGYLAAEN